MWATLVGGCLGRLGGLRCHMRTGASGFSQLRAETFLSIAEVGNAPHFLLSTHRRSQALQVRDPAWEAGALCPLC